MGHVDILAKFLGMFPAYMNNMVMWEPYGSDAVKLTMRDHTELVFKYVDEYNWSLSSGLGKEGRA